MSTQDSSRQPAATSSPLEFRQLLQLFYRAWWFIVPCALAAAGGAFRYVSHMPISYTAKATIQVEQEDQRIVTIEPVNKDDVRSSEVLNTIVANIKNSSVLIRVVRTNDLVHDPLFIANVTNMVNEMKAVRMLAGMVNCKLRKDTRLIDILVEHREASMAQKLANSIAQECIRQNLDQRFSVADSANERLVTRTAQLKLKLENSEKALQAYKEQKQTVGLEDRRSIVMEKLKEFSKKCTEAKAARVQLESDLRAMQVITNSESLFALSGGIQDPALSDMRQKVLAQQTKVQTLSTRYLPAHPKMLEAQRELLDLRHALEQLLESAKRIMTVSYENGVNRERSLEKALHDTQQDALQLERSSSEFEVLAREVKQDGDLYQAALARQKENDFTKDLEKRNISVAEPAGFPSSTAHPSRVIATIMGFCLGFAGGFGLVYGLSLLDSSLRTVDQAEIALGLPVMSAIPRTSGRRRKQLPHVAGEEPDSVCTESFRSLRTAVALLGPAESKKIVLFTSAVPHEGKTFCSLNYAICQAQEGLRTLLIDLDLRRPSIGSAFAQPVDTLGVTDYLLNKGQLKKLVRATRYSGLQILPAGPIIPDPAEHLGKGSIKRLLEEAVSQYDRVVIDTAPINAVSDTFLILPCAHVVLLVVKSGQTSKRAIMRAVELMARANVPPHGTVLNYLPKRSGYGYYYYYSQDDGYSRKESSGVRLRGKATELAAS